MDAIISNVGCGVVSSIVYDIGKICLGKFYCSKNENSIEDIERLIKQELDEKYEILYMSGEFNDFLSTSFFKDTIENYIIYKITGNCEGSIRKIKKNNTLIMEKDVIDYLISNLFDKYFDKVIATMPSKTFVRSFFEDLFKFAANYVVSLMKDEKKADLFFINNRIDFAQENILLRFNETVEIIKRTMACEVIPSKDTYDEYIKEYHSILKANHSRAHVYLLDTFDFSEFYVPPSLRKGSSRLDRIEHIRLMQIDYLLYSNSKEDVDSIKEKYFDDWKYIFEQTGIVYVTGGAGYGKSLFLKKLINDFEHINTFNSSEYLVIYGDLKSFFVDDEQPVSVLKFLQDSMIKETLLDEKNFPIDLIEYYIKMGRCLILLDALDEVEKQKREQLHKRLIAYFKKQNPNNRICITSRNRGFIPEKDVEVYNILPLDRMQIESYVDNIIKLGRFDSKDKKAFLEQSNALVEKGFLNSFLVLSLLINIYKAERELPENKMELYQKCFDYIAYRREKEKTKAKFDWDLISCMMKDNTFMELAKLCFPNNSDIGKNEIVDMLCKTYGGKYVSLAEAERAAEHFLAFCSDRTELFVPAAGEERFKFFHRSFFEYFYAQYIFLRIRDVEEVYNSLQKFDVDSEVFELTIAMMKQKDEPRYQELIEYILEKMDDEAKTKSTKLPAFNILTLGMQVVDDNLYVCKFIEYLVKNKLHIVKNIEHIANQIIVYNVICSNDIYIKQVIKAYESVAKLSIIENFLEQFSEYEKIIIHKDFPLFSEEDKKSIIKHRFEARLGNSFFMRLYITKANYHNVLNGLSESKLEQLMLECKVAKKTREKYMKLYNKYKASDKKRQKLIKELTIGSTCL